MEDSKEFLKGQARNLENYTGNSEDLEDQVRYDISYKEYLAN